MAEARQVESDAATFLDQISRYFLTRAKIVSKVAKYPHVVSQRLHALSVTLLLVPHSSMHSFPHLTVKNCYILYIFIVRVIIMQKFPGPFICRFISPLIYL